MTARDEAIEAMASVFKLRWSSREDNCADLLDAIPPNVLARLAIEQGALTRIETPSGPVYRVVEP